MQAAAAPAAVQAGRPLLAVLRLPAGIRGLSVPGGLRGLPEHRQPVQADLCILQGPAGEGVRAAPAAEAGGEQRMCWSCESVRLGA